MGGRGGTWARWAMAKARVSREMVSKESESCEKAGRRRRRSEGAADSGLGAQSMVRLRGSKDGWRWIERECGEDGRGERTTREGERMSWAPGHQHEGNRGGGWRQTRPRPAKALQGSGQAPTGYPTIRRPRPHLPTARRRRRRGTCAMRMLSIPTLARQVKTMRATTVNVCGGAGALPQRGRRARAGGGAG